MKKYEKPIVMINDELAEGVYAGSGDCYTVEAKIEQGPDRAAYHSNYVVKIDGKHSAADNHHSSARKIRIEFNLPVTYISSNAASCEGNGTNTLTLLYVQTGDAYHNNANETIGLGDLNIDAAHGLEVKSTKCVYCSETCDDGHTW